MIWHDLVWHYCANLIAIESWHITQTEEYSCFESEGHGVSSHKSTPISFSFIPKYLVSGSPCRAGDARSQTSASAVIMKSGRLLYIVDAAFINKPNLKLRFVGKCSCVCLVLTIFLEMLYSAHLQGTLKFYRMVTIDS